MNGPRSADHVDHPLEPVLPILLQSVLQCELIKPIYTSVGRGEDSFQLSEGVADIRV